MRLPIFAACIAVIAALHPAQAATQNPTRPVMLSEKAEQCDFLGPLAADKAGEAKRPGEYVSASYDEAFKWCRDAADQGVMTAQAALGAQYEGGQGVKQDYVAAAKWYDRAAAQGDAGAQMALGRLYYKGLGVRQSDTQAFFWLVLSSNAGNTAAAAPRDEVWARLTQEQASDVFRQTASWKPHPDLSQLRRNH